MEKEERFPVPVLSVVGYSGSGKTTYLEKLIPCLKKRGLRLCVVKHDVHSFDIDVPGKDSWRLRQAGADVTMIVSPAKLAVIEQWETPETLEQLSRRVKGKADLLLTEGFKRGNAPKIEIRRKAVDHEAMCEREELFAIASDYDLPDDTGIPWLTLDDAEPMVELIIERLITR